MQREDFFDAGRPVGENDHPVRQSDGFRQIVGYQDGGFSLFSKDPSDVVPHFQAGLVIQSRERLVKEQKVKVMITDGTVSTVIISPDLYNTFVSTVEKYAASRGTAANID